MSQMQFTVRGQTLREIKSKIHAETSKFLGDLEGPSTEYMMDIIADEVGLETMDDPYRRDIVGYTAHVTVLL